MLPPLVDTLPAACPVSVDPFRYVDLLSAHHITIYLTVFRQQSFESRPVEICAM